MSNELMVTNNFPTQVELQSVALIARTAKASQLYSNVGDEAKIMMILLAARELGVGPCQALNGGIWSIQGKIEISARLMNGLIRRAGHSIKVIKSTDTECVLLGTRTDGDSFECSFTIDDATKAGLAGGNVWKKYPGDMLYNRCMSRLARRLFSDVIGQCYVEGEISEGVAQEKLMKADCEDVTPQVRGPAPVAPTSDIPTPPASEPLPTISQEHADELVKKLSELPRDQAQLIYDYIDKTYGTRSMFDILECKYEIILECINRGKKAATAIIPKSEDK